MSPVFLLLSPFLPASESILLSPSTWPLLSFSLSLYLSLSPSLPFSLCLSLTLSSSLCVSLSFSLSLYLSVSFWYCGLNYHYILDFYWGFSFVLTHLQGSLEYFKLLKNYNSIIIWKISQRSQIQVDVTSTIVLGLYIKILNAYINSIFYPCVQRYLLYVPFPT